MHTAQLHVILTSSCISRLLVAGTRTGSRKNWINVMWPFMPPT